MRRIGGSIAGLCLATAALADDGVVPGTLSDIMSCARSGPAIVLRDGERRVLLDTDDRDRVQAALVERYPALQRDGFDSPYILLWHKGGQDWLYVSLIAIDEPSPILCFTATFAAKGFTLTRDLLQKYFAAGGAPS